MSRAMPISSTNCAFSPLPRSSVPRNPSREGMMPEVTVGIRISEPLPPTRLRYSTPASTMP